MYTVTIKHPDDAIECRAGLTFEEACIMREHYLADRDELEDNLLEVRIEGPEGELV